METTKDINRIKVVLVEKKRTNKWLAEQLGKDPATVSKWCTNTAQPSLETLLEITKVLEVDVLQAVPGYVHDKAEGMALVGDSVIVVVNDDDFGVATGDGEMPYKPKLNPSGRLDFNELVFIRHRMEEQMDGGPRQP